MGFKSRRSSSGGGEGGGRRYAVHKGCSVNSLQFLSDRESVIPLGRKLGLSFIKHPSSPTYKWYSDIR